MWICRLAKRSILADGEEVIRNRKIETPVGRKGIK